MLDARRQQVYTGLYRYEEKFEIVKEQYITDIHALIAELNERGERVIFLGDGVPVNRVVIEEEMQVPYSFAPAQASRQRASAVAALGAVYLAEGKTETAAGHKPGIVHRDNSAGVMLHPDWPEGLLRAHCMARPGIILYGFDPSDEVRFGKFRPVMKLKTVVSMVKELQPGQSTSYGRRFTAETPTRVATLCTGYAAVRQGGFAVVDVGDDTEIADVVSCHLFLR